MNDVFWALIALGLTIIAIIAIIAVVVVTLWAVKQLDAAWLPPAKSGIWFPRYHAAWTHAHPGAFERGDAKSGGFYLGTGARAGEDVWGSSTLEWDREWFRANGMGMPRHTTYVDPPGPAKPNEFRIGTLGPGESVSIPITFDREADK